MQKRWKTVLTTLPLASLFLLAPVEPAQADHYRYPNNGYYSPGRYYDNFDRRLRDSYRRFDRRIRRGYDNFRYGRYGRYGNDRYDSPRRYRNRRYNNGAYCPRY